MSKGFRKILAEKFATQLKNHQEIEAIFIGGSVATNQVDEYSDLELCFIWENRPSIEKIKSIRKVLDISSFHKNITNDEHQNIQIEDCVRYQNFQIDIFHTHLPYIHQLIKDVTEQYDINFNKHNYLYVLQNVIPLKGEETIASLKSKSNNYPRKLAIAFIEKRIEPFFGADLNLFLQRKEWVLFYNLITSYLKLIFLTLTAINKMYFPTYKRMNASLAKMEIKPDGLITFQSEFHQKPPQGVLQELTQLKKNVLLLVNEHFPEIETNHLLKKMDCKRNLFKGLTRM